MNEAPEVPIAETMDCDHCGVPIMTYDSDGELIDRLRDWCRHLSICRDCEQELEQLEGDRVLATGCPKCNELRRETYDETRIEEAESMRRNG